MGERKAKYDVEMIIRLSTEGCVTKQVYTLSSCEPRGELYESDTGLFSSFPEDLSFDMSSFL